MIDVSEKDGAVIFSVKVVPRASKTELVGEHGGALKIRIAAPPVEGAANEELIKFLAKTFGVAKSAIEIVAGEQGRRKTVRVLGVSRDEMLETCLRSFGF